MSFKRLDPEDIVISSDSITAPAWSNHAVELNAFYLSSLQAGSDSGDYYLNVYDKDADSDDTAAIQFSVAFGHRLGSGSGAFDSNYPSNSRSSVIYKQARTLALGTEDEDFIFHTTTPDHIYTINVERARYKEKLLPQSLTLTLTNGSDSLVLTDNSKYTTAETYTDAGRVYEIISGAAGEVTASPLDGAGDGYSPGSGSYGKFLPDIGMIILNGAALDESGLNGGIALGTELKSSIDPTLVGENNNTFFNAISAGGSFKLRSEETVSSNYIFVRARNSEFNYSTNPSNITGSGELRHDVMIDSPQAYVTAVGLYNDNNDLLAVAKLSRPLLKDFTKEALVRIKLDY